MNIKIAQIKDIDGIAKLYPAVTESMAEFEPFYYKKSEQSKSYIEEIITNDDSDFIVAVSDSKIVGFALVEEMKTPPYDCFVPHKYTFIMDVVVDKDYRRKGIATALLSEVRKWAEDRKSDYIELNVLSKNIQAINLYENLQFEECAKRMKLKL